MDLIRGSAGVNEAQSAGRALEGFEVSFGPAIGDKQTRAKPVSSQAEAGNIMIVKGPWNEAFYRELENFPESKLDDLIYAVSGSFLVSLFISAHGYLLGTCFLGGNINDYCNTKFQSNLSRMRHVQH
ncbi:MAG: phage terminase large subunit [Verrucomicrobiales bacterium]